MSSLTISLVLSSPTKYCTKINSVSSTSCYILQLKKDSRPSFKLGAQSQSHPTAPFSLQTQENVKNVISRREVIGGTGVILGTVLHEKSKIAIASEEPGSCEFTVSPSGLAFCDKLVGVGPQAAAGQLIKAHYVGKLENGKIFDSSYGRGKPLTFRVGVGEVIKGWDQGILGTEGVPPMLSGGKRTLRIPPELGYGIRGAGCRGGTCIIPPDSVLFFDVEFVGKA